MLKVDVAGSDDEEAIEMKAAYTVTVDTKKTIVQKKRGRLDETADDDGDPNDGSTPRSDPSPSSEKGQSSVLKTMAAFFTWCEAAFGGEYIHFRMMFVNLI
jgi:hypothetical protein